MLYYTHTTQGYPRGSKELLGPLSAKFGPWETFDWFSSKGIDLKTEKDGRVFPITDRYSYIFKSVKTLRTCCQIESRSRLSNVIEIISVDVSYECLSLFFNG